MNGEAHQGDGATDTGTATDIKVVSFYILEVTLLCVCVCVCACSVYISI